MMPEIKTWFYQHYKGKHCKVLGIALHSETNEPLVIYQNCDDSQQTGKMELRARPYELFVEWVETPQGEVPRFVYVGDSYS